MSIDYHAWDDNNNTSVFADCRCPSVHREIPRREAYRVTIGQRNPAREKRCDPAITIPAEFSVTRRSPTAPPAGRLPPSLTNKGGAIQCYFFDTQLSRQITPLKRLSSHHFLRLKNRKIARERACNTDNFWNKAPDVSRRYVNT